MSSLNVNHILIPESKRNPIGRQLGRSDATWGAPPRRDKHGLIKVHMAGLASGSVQGSLNYDQTVIVSLQIVGEANVSSVTDNGSGDFEPDFLTPFISSTGRTFQHCATHTGGTVNVYITAPNESAAPTNDTHAFMSSNASGTPTDYHANYITAHGELA